MAVSREFKGIWIPRDIWLHENLTIKEKVFLAEIHSLTSNEHGYCWASNDHFSKFSGLSKNAASKTMATLKQKGFIDIKLVYEGKEIKERRIYVLEYGGYSQNDNRGYSQNDKGYSQNDKGSNTINNTHGKASLRDGINPTDSLNSNNIDSNDIDKKPVDREKLKPKHNSLKRNTTLLKEKEINITSVPKRIVALIEYWNSFDSLRTMRISYSSKRKKVLYGEQSATMRKTIDLLSLIISGKFYTTANIDKKFIPRKVTLSKIRMAIERCARACSPEYSKKPFRMSFNQFIHSDGVQQEGIDKYRFIYPLIHFLVNEPKVVASCKIKRKTKYPKTVERVMLVIGIKGDNHAYNRIVTYVESATNMLKEKSNGNFQSNLSELSSRVEEGVSGKLTMDNVHFGFMHLETTYRKHLKLNK